MDKLLNEGFIERDVSDQFFDLGTFGYILGGSYQLWLEEHKIVVAAFELEILAHNVSQVGTKLDLHIKRHGANSMVIGRQVLLYILVGLFGGRRGKVIIGVSHVRLLGLLHNGVLKLFVDKFAQVCEQFDRLDLDIEGGQVNIELLCLRVPLSIFVGIVEELTKEMAHHVDDTDTGQLVTRHGQDVEPDLVRVK